MRITLAVPYHARPDLLAKTLASIAAQADDHWDCLVSDDSPDGSGGAPVAALAHPRIRHVVNPAPAGMVANWMHAVRTAETPWVSLTHADDELEPGYVGLMRRLAASHPDAAMLYCQARIIDLDGRPIFSFPDYVKRWIDPSGGGDLVLRGEEGAASLLGGSFIMCPTACYRREVLLAEPFDPRWRQVQDLELFLRLLRLGHVIVGSGERAYRYRRHENATAIATRDLSRFHEELALYKDQADRLAGIGWRKAARVAGAKRIVRLHLAYRALQDLTRGRLGPARDKLRLLC